MTIAMSNRFIEKLNGYGQLTAEAVIALERATSHPLAYAARRDLIREGDRPGPPLVMLEGWAFRYKMLSNGTRQIMGFMMPGDAFDLNIGMVTEMDHSIQTQTAAQIAKIERESVDALMDEHPGIARAMYIAQIVDEGTLRAWIVSLGRRSSIERVAHLLLELYVRGAKRGFASEKQIALPLSQIVLADALGMTTVHINRVLQELRRSASIELTRGMLRILDPAALVRISGFDESYLHKTLSAQYKKQ